jgi:wobble nucleotide-excising tRNase
MTIIKKISRIKHPGVLRDFTWPTDLPTFGRYNLIYGWNGSGKTTISKLFRALELRKPPEGEATLEINNVSVTGGEFSQAALPVRVFNRDFIAESVFPAGGSEVPPIFVLGKESAEKQAQVEKLKGQQAAANSEGEIAKQEKTKAERALDKHCVERATVIREVLRSSGSNPYNNYDKTKYKQRVLAMSNAGDIDSHVLSDDVRARLLSQSRATQRVSISEVQYRLPDVQAFTEEANRLMQKSVVSSAIAALKNDALLSSWTREGLGLHLQRHADNCLFCEQPLPDGRISAIEGHFSTEYEQLLRQLDTHIAQLETALRFSGQFSLPNRAEFYEDLAADYDKVKTTFDASIQAVNAYLAILIEALQRKKQKVFEAQTFDTPLPGVLSTVVGDVNAIIKRHNQACADFEDRVKAAREKLEADMVATTLDEYLELTKAVDLQVSAITQADGISRQLTMQITQLEREIIEHRQPAEELNDDLYKYLGHAELQLEVRDTGYIISRNGSPAHSLSEGEMTAIALLYFLKSLKDRRFEMKRGIIVLDDPVSSLDANALFLAFGFIRQCTGDAAQLFILTHNFAMFRQVRNWFHHLKDQGKNDIAKRPARFYMMECSLTNQGRCSRIAPLDTLLKQFESEYHYLFSRVYRESQKSGKAGLEANYIFPNMARRLLETFLAFRRPQHAGELHQKLKSITFDEVKKLRILRFLHTHSHADAIGDPEHDPSALGEAQAVLTDLLALIKHEDQTHYDAMVELVAPPAKTEDSE